MSHTAWKQEATMSCNIIIQIFLVLQFMQVHLSRVVCFVQVSFLFWFSHVDKLKDSVLYCPVQGSSTCFQHVSIANFLLWRWYGDTCLQELTLPQWRGAQHPYSTRADGGRLKPSMQTRPTAVKTSLDHTWSQGFGPVIPRTIYFAVGRAKRV